jgi:CRISPR-associated protein Cas1
MITRTLYFSKPAYLKCRQEQLVVEYPEQPKIDHYSPIKGEHLPTVPIEDIGLLILDNHQITITTYLLHRLLAQNVGIITCNEKHLPTGMMLNLDGHTLQSAKVNDQINASIPLKKQLWKQTIEAKIKNQSSVLDSINVSTTNMMRWREEVKSGYPPKMVHIAYQV